MVMRTSPAMHKLEWWKRVNFGLSTPGRRSVDITSGSCQYRFMSSSFNRWHRIEALFYEALDLAPEARSAFLKEKCGGDFELRKEVDSLLASADKPVDFLEKPVFAAAERVISEQNRGMISPGTKLAHYEIISMLGVGGLGEVYLAEDTRLRRKVALKMLIPELTRDESGLRRFEQEAHAASALNHPNILTIFEFGQTDGCHFHCLRIH